MKPVIDYTLYLVTDQTSCRPRPSSRPSRPPAQVASRSSSYARSTPHARNSSTSARRVKRVCDKHDIPLIINDEPEIAVEIGAAGVHVDREDLEASCVREIVGPDAIVGVRGVRRRGTGRAAGGRGTTCRRRRQHRDQAGGRCPDHRGACT